MDSVTLLPLPAGLTPDERDNLIVTHIPLVRQVLHRLRGSGNSGTMDYEDLVSIGIAGLIQAVDRFDDCRGTPFRSYAAPRIRGAIIDALRAADHLSRPARQAVKLVEHTHSALSQALGREPSASEIQAAAGLSTQQYEVAMIASRWTTFSLNSGMNQKHDEEPTPIDLPDTSPDFSEEVIKRELLDELAHALTQLPYRERLTITLSYKEGLTLREIATVLHVSESRVSQLRVQAINRLKKRLLTSHDQIKAS